jgi:hypothetical protein
MAISRQLTVNGLFWDDFPLATGNIDTPIVFD